MPRDAGGGGMDPNAWMATFSDLLSLLLTFFVLLYAMKSLDQGKLKEMLGHFRQGGIGVLLPGSVMPLKSPDALGLKDLAKRTVSLSEITRFLSGKDFKHQVSVSSNDKGLVLAISSAVLFPSGARLQPEAEVVLDEILELIQGGDHLIQVVGYTDSTPPNSFLYPTNWDLSIARAGSVARYIVDKGVIAPRRLSIVGYADTRPVKRTSSSDHKKQNSRVELLLLR